jgi:hypothetical protein
VEIPPAVVKEMFPALAPVPASALERTVTLPLLVESSAERVMYPFAAKRNLPPDDTGLVLAPERFMFAVLSITVVPEVAAFNCEVSVAGVMLDVPVVVVYQVLFIQDPPVSVVPAAIVTSDARPESVEVTEK